MMTMTTIYYSPSTGWFYSSDDFSADAIPADASIVPHDEHSKLVLGLAAGKTIQIDAAGRRVLTDRPPTSTSALLDQLTRAVQAHLDAAARSAGYDSIYTAVSYADEPAVPRFQAEGAAFRTWRSLVWDAANTIRAAVESGARPIPTAEQLIAELPLLSLPA